jgi:hypothetical protein
MFEPVLETTFELVKKQVSRIEEVQPRSCKVRVSSRSHERDENAETVQTIVLCGGMGEYGYVYDRFQKFIDTFFGEGKVELVNPPRAWSAVARGAAMHALLKKPVMYRRSRHHIGMVVHQDFKEGKHREEDRVWCAVMKMDRARDQMKWFISRVRTTNPSLPEILTTMQGDKMSINKKIIVQCYASLDTREEPYVHQKLYRCQMKVPPSRLSYSGKLTKQPLWRNFNEVIVDEIGTITCDLSKPLEEERTKYKRAKTTLPCDAGFPVDVHITMSSVKGVLEAEARHGVRRKIGTTTIEYVPDPTSRQGLVHEDEDDEEDEDEQGDEEDEIADDDGDEGE